MRYPRIWKHSRRSRVGNKESYGGSHNDNATPLSDDSGIIETGACPTNETLAELLGLSLVEVEDGLCALAQEHGVVLHPYAVRPWVVHPFSLTPTLNWIESDRLGWWAPCIWCSMGIGTIVGGSVTTYTRIGAERAPITIHMQDGTLKDNEDLVVHFPIPPAHAWQNVHEHCAMVLPLRASGDIPIWCDQHRLPKLWMIHGGRDVATLTRQFAIESFKSKILGFFMRHQ